jgi:hypothetical protein
MAHKHIDLSAAARAAFRDKLRRRRRSDDNRALASRHHNAERTVSQPTA